ncbi:hypothetical protein PR048_008416 [Dryococelus australis]|uniref:Uncharacterized protein n=1 Tax=Dryococelus australis TaxID=614101 RepID=A0ABQ9HXC5_9NEOP|nr:hypothetical protein PR048_008416 [Dryococelus australis]
MRSDLAHYCVYHGGEAHKGPNEVASMLLDYIEQDVPLAFKELHLFADNCPGQNKNHILVKFCLEVVDTHRYQIVKHNPATRTQQSPDPRAEVIKMSAASNGRDTEGCRCPGVGINKFLRREASNPSIL